MNQVRPYIVVAAGTFLMLMMGIAYSWGIYTDPLIEEFGWTKSEASLPFSFFLLFYTVGIIIGGRLQDNYGPRIVCTAGIFFFGLGYLLSGFASNLAHLCFVYGIVAGIGSGFAYVTPVAAVVKWFPHKKGLMGGIVLFGFGAGAFLFSPIVRQLISAYSWQTSFIYLGSTFTVLGLVLSQLITLPPDGHIDQFVLANKVKQPLAEMSPSQVLKTPIFWLAWSAWLLALIVGLGLMGHIVSYAIEHDIDEMTAAFVLSIIAIFNGTGRIVMGGISDRVGCPQSLAGTCFIMAVVLILMFLFPPSAAFLYFVGAVFGLCFGTWLVLIPMTVSDLFGVKHLGVNYGLLISSYGVGGFTGPLLYGNIYDATGDYNTVFMLSAIMCAVAGLLALGVMVKKSH